MNLHIKNGRVIDPETGKDAAGDVYVADGKIVEDWTSSDDLGLLRRLGPWRTLLLGVNWLIAEVKRRR